MRIGKRGLEEPFWFLLSYQIILKYWKYQYFRLWWSETFFFFFWLKLKDKLKEKIYFLKSKDINLINSVDLLTNFFQFRWCVLTEDYLYYFPSNTSEKPKNVLPIKNFRAIEILTNFDSIEPKPPKSDDFTCFLKLYNPSDEDVRIFVFGVKDQAGQLAFCIHIFGILTLSLHSRSWTMDWNDPCVVFWNQEVAIFTFRENHFLICDK